MTSFSPREIVSELDRHIIGQRDAKRAVAIALRNRWRRQQLDEEMREEVLPKNILMIGPTGVGKTEISRRLAKLAGAPFIKVEATKFTEVGYVGRDVDQIVRDLLEAGIGLVRDVKRKEVAAKAQLNAEERVIDALVGSGAAVSTREAFRKRLRSGELDDKEIEIQVADMPSMPSFDIPGMPGSQVGMINLSEVLGKALGNRTKPRKVTVRDSFDILLGEESDKLIDNDSIVQEAIRNVENNGIVFLDEIDKICARSERVGADVSREGVQRDLLPLIEGTTVGTKYGPVKTDHILFIASGAFHIAKPSDLLPELQGRLPIRVELRALTRDDFRRILTEPKACLIKQYVALMQTEGVELEFTPDSIEAIADVAVEVNTAVENIGARRLMTVMERILDNISFDAGDRAGEKVVIDAAYVEKHIGDLAKNADLSKFILVAPRSPQAHIERAFAAESARRFRIAQHHMRQVGRSQPMRHGLPEHAALIRLVERPGLIDGRALAGDDQHMAIALPLRRFEEAPQRRMRLALPHAVQVEPRFDGELAALELPRRLPVKRFALRGWRGLRHWLGRGLFRGR